MGVGGDVFEQPDDLVILAFIDAYGFSDGILIAEIFSCRGLRDKASSWFSQILHRITLDEIELHDFEEFRLNVEYSFLEKLQILIRDHRAAGFEDPSDFLHFRVSLTNARRGRRAAGSKTDSLAAVFIGAFVS